MVKLGELALKGRSGNTYSFDVYLANTSWADGVACVYYVSKRTPNPNGGFTHTAIYVGETENVRQRFEGHHKQSCFSRHGYTAISIHRVSGGAQARRDIESDLIAKQNPPCND